MPQRPEGTKGLDLYRLHQPALRTGDVLLYQGSGPLSWLIRRFTTHSHAGLVIRLREFEGEQKRRYTLEALASGVRLNYLSRKLSGYGGRVYWLPLRARYDGDRHAVGAEAMKYLGVGYDFSSLFRNAAGRVAPGLRRLFCSEAVWAAAAGAGLPVPSSTMSRAPRPGDLLDWQIYDTAVRIY